MTRYQAKIAYQHESAATTYEERPYYQGLLGRVRKAREARAVRTAIQYFDRSSKILDCPCGNGRWFSSLSRAASHIIAIDVSETMIDAALKRVVREVNVEVRRGDAEAMDIPDSTIDHVFSYALMKHLPLNVKRTVLHEFARVSVGRVAVSFTILTPLNYLFWRLRGSSAYPIWWSELLRLAESENLAPIARLKVGLPGIGMETVIVFDRRNS